MNHEHDESGNCCAFNRRRLFGMAAAGAVAAAGLVTPAAAQVLTAEMRDALTPEQIVDLIIEGNARFVAGTPQPRDWLAEQRGTADGQHPAAVFLSCVDSRAPVEVLCDFGIGQAFNARVAGNAVNDDILGSIEFATAVAGAKVVMVMGHSACGAIKGAIDDVRLGNLTLLLARFKNAIEATEYAGERSTKNPDYVDAVARTHVQHSVELIRERSPVLRDLEKQKKIMIVGAFYDLDSGRISLV